MNKKERVGAGTSILIHLIFSSIYSDLTMYLNYFNEKKLWIPKVLQALLDTA